MTRCGDLEEQLSLYIDDLLSPSETTEVQAHIETCAACAGLVRDLGGIARSARLLGPITPPEQMYANIERQLTRIDARAGDRGMPPGRPLWRWVAIAATLVTAVTVTYLAVGGQRVNAPVTAPAPAAVSAFETIAAELELAVHHYEQAIRELETVTRVADEGLDPDVAASVRRSLSALDVAITESRQALKHDPASEPARISLFEALRRKIDLLQATALIVNYSQDERPAEPARPVNATGREL
jgi:anti-sigma factor RsiW